MTGVVLINIQVGNMVFMYFNWQIEQLRVRKSASLF